jgi:hypothetical protein
MIKNNNENEYIINNENDEIIMKKIIIKMNI